MGGDLNGSWKGRCHLGKVDGFDLEQGDNKRRKALDASEMPAEMELEHIGEHAMMIHGVISLYMHRCGKARG